MSKSLPTSALALLLAACEPVSTSVVQLLPYDGAPPIQDAAVLARDASAEPNAVRADADPEGCLLLRDQTIPELLTSAEQAARQVIAKNSSVEGCKDDAGMAYGSSTVFERSDGSPLLERGKAYSYRWPAGTTVITRVNLVGGDEFCSSEPIVFAENVYFTGHFASCWEFTSPIHARYVRIDGRDFPSLQWLNLGKPALTFKLCPTPCPAGTEPTPQDAGAAANDAALPGQP